MTYPTIRAAALAFLDAFERKTRDNGDSFYCLKNDRPGWMVNAIRAAHDGKMPDDWTYDACHSIVCALCDSDDDATEGDIRNRDGEIIYSCIDCYTNRLALWLASDSARVGYCEEAGKEYGAQTDIVRAMQQGQYYELSLIFEPLLSAIVAQGEEGDSE
jgi:hypothetical protein